MNPLEIGLQLANIAGNQINSQIQYGQQRRLMEIQQQNQMQLNRQGQQIQLDTWEKTNYPAQIAMLKKAGLNPSLMYAKGGQGGTTGSQGGGSASGGSAPQRQPMDLGNILAFKNMQLQAELTKSQKEKTDAETKEIEARTPTYETSMGKMIAETKNTEVRTKLTEIEMLLKQADTDKAIQETVNLKTQNALTQAQFDDIVKLTTQTLIGKKLENALTEARTTMTRQETEAISVELAQKAEQLMLNIRGLDQKDKEIAIQRFRAEMEAITQPLGKVAGKFVYEIINDLNRISSQILLPGQAQKDYVNVKY